MHQAFNVHHSLGGKNTFHYMILGHLDAALELKNMRLNSFKKFELCLNESFIFKCKQFCKFIEKLAPSHVKIKEIVSYIPIVCSSTFKMKSLDFL